MKRCPQCQKLYSDENQFCLNDGTVLSFDSGGSQSYPGDAPTVFMPKIPALGAPEARSSANHAFVCAALGLVGGVVLVLAYFTLAPRSPEDKTRTVAAAQVSPTAEASPVKSENEIVGKPVAPQIQQVAPQTPPATATIPGRFPEGSLRLLTENDLYGKSDWDLRVMRNEIFARHGYIFNKPELRSYFLAQPWYKPINYDVSMFLNRIEKANIEFLKRHE